MSHKTEVLAFDREKRVYKDAYVDNFRRVRHFPALAAIGAGHSDGDSIILVQEASQPENPVAGATADSISRHAKSKLDDVQSRLMPKDPLSEMFATTSPLTSFRTAVTCKHTLARQELAVNAAASSSSDPHRHNKSDPPSSAFAPRYDVMTKQTFKPSSAVEAKTTIQRKVTYDSEPFSRPPPVGRAFTPPTNKSDWAYNNPIAAKEDVRTKTYFHAPPEGVVRADRRYTQDFIQQHVDAYQLSRQQQAIQSRRSGAAP